VLADADNVRPFLPSAPALAYCVAPSQRGKILCILPAETVLITSDPAAELRHVLLSDAARLAVAIVSMTIGLLVKFKIMAVKRIVTTNHAHGNQPKATLDLIETGAAGSLSGIGSRAKSNCALKMSVNFVIKYCNFV
jgi:hypothetical protein